MTEIEIPRDVICDVGYWEIDSTQFKHTDFKIIQVERVNGDDHSSTFRAVVQHVESGRFFEFGFIHSHSYHDIEPDQYGDGVVEVYPQEVTTVIYTTTPSKDN